MDFSNQKWVEEFCAKAKEKRGQSKYDVLVPISGGKDGSFLLWYICKHTDLRVLAFHIDNWYVGDTARKNVENICKDLGCDLEIVRPGWGTIKNLYRKLFMLNGEICAACEMMISLYPIECATLNHIPYIAWGLTPTQIKGKKINAGYLPIDFNYYNKIAKYYEELVCSIYKDVEERQHIEDSLLKNPSMAEQTEYPTFIMPYYWLDYDAGEIEDTVSKEIGWKRPKEAGGTSSNCVINQLHIYLKKKIKGEEFYRSMMEKKASVNEVTDDVKNKALDNAVDHELFQKIYKELDINCTEEDLIYTIKNAEKDFIVKMQANISQ